MRKQSRNDRDGGLVALTFLCAAFGLVLVAYDIWMISSGRPGQGFYIYPVVFFIFAGMFLYVMRRDRALAGPVRKRPPSGPTPD